MLDQFLSGSSGVENLFWVLAVFASAFFILRVSLMVFMGLGLEHGGDIYHDVDSASGTEGAFRLLSINTITVFLMMFGWIGLAGLHEWGLAPTAAMLAGAAAGFVSMVIVGYLFSLAVKLQTSGDEFKVEDAVGQPATVYQRIPKDGSGRVNVSVNGRTRELEAVSELKEDIESFKNVVVVKVINPQTVSVKVTQ